MSFALSDGIELSKVKIQNIDDTFIPMTNMAYDDLSVINPTGIPMDMGEDVVLSQGESIELNVWLGDDVSYVWNDGNTEAIRNISEPGLYSVTIVRDGFTIQGSVSIEDETTANDNIVNEISLEISPNPLQKF